MTPHNLVRCMAVRGGAGSTAGQSKAIFAIALVLTSLAGCISPTGTDAVETGSTGSTTNTPPALSITKPSPGTAIAGITQISGTSEDLDVGGAIKEVQVKVDTGVWLPATGTTAWAYVLDAAGLSSGEHTIYARASDGVSYSAIAAVSVVVSGASSTDGSSDAHGSENNSGANTAPAVTANGPARLRIGETGHFTVTASDLDGDALSFVWDFGDGGSAASGREVSRSFTSAGTYIVRVTVGDGKAHVERTLSVTVTSPNQSPVIDAGPAISAYVGQTVSFPGATAKDADGDGLIFDWDFGDGSAHAAILHPSHVYNAAGAFTATLRVSDGQDTVSDTVLVTVAYAANQLWKKGTDDPIRWVSVSANGEYVAAANLSDNSDKPSWVFLYTKDGNLKWSKPLPVVTSGTYFITKTAERGRGVGVADDGSVSVLTTRRTLHVYDSVGAAKASATIPDDSSGFVIQGLDRLAMSADGSRIYVAYGYSVYAYSGTAQLLWNHKVGNGVNAIATSADGQILAAGGDDKYVTLFDSVGNVLLEKKLYDEIKSIAIADDGKTIAVVQGSFLGNLTLLKRDGQVTWVSKSGTYPDSVGITDDGSFIVYTTSAKVHFARAGGPDMWVFEARNTAWDTAVSAAGKIVALGSEDGFLYVLTW